MSKHLIDQPRTTAEGALPQFLRVERAEKLHNSTKSLSARLRKRSSDRLTAYTRIARGRST
jgi:hypothetical protein